ncbi:hypothetical protein THIOSC15_1310005 [uncultured Thiomicrorhabdus sp.]
MYVRKGHFHKRGKDATPDISEIDGVVVETFPTLAAPDAYAAEQAYVSQRATVANLGTKSTGNDPDLRYLPANCFNNKQR